MKTVVSIKELMARWGVSRASINKMESAGCLKRLKIPGIYFSLKNVLDIESIDEKELEHSPFEWRRLKNELKDAQQELRRYRAFISNLSLNMSQFECEERARENER
mgnify:CR=1 FL=1